MRKVIQYIIKIIGWAAIIIWGLLTFVVLIFLIDRWTHPHTKSISNVDLLTYGNFSLWLLGIFITSKIIIWIFDIWRKKYSSLH
jgi:hypothetical protein